MINGKLLVYPALWSPLSAEGGNNLNKKSTFIVTTAPVSHHSQWTLCPAVIIVQDEAMKISPEFPAVFINSNLARRRDG